MNEIEVVLISTFFFGLGLKSFNFYHFLVLLGYVQYFFPIFKFNLVLGCFFPPLILPILSFEKILRLIYYLSQAKSH